MNFRFSFVLKLHVSFFFSCRYVDRFFRYFLFGQRWKFTRNIRIRMSRLITSLHAWTTIRDRFQFQTTRFVYLLSWANARLSTSSLHMFIAFTNMSWFVKKIDVSIPKEIDVNLTKFWTMILTQYDMKC